MEGGGENKGILGIVVRRLGIVGIEGNENLGMLARVGMVEIFGFGGDVMEGLCGCGSDGMVGMCGCGNVGI